MNTSVLSTSTTSHTFDLLAYYSFEAEHYPQLSTKVQILDRWLKTYPEQWVRLALIESLYQGRYKVFSVEQVLALWNRRGHPVYHFSPEFEELVCCDVPHQMDRATMPPQAMVLQSKPNAPPLKPESSQDASVLDPTQTSEIQIQTLEQSIKTGRSPQDLFEDPWGDATGTRLESMLDIWTMLPVTVGRLGLVPIHQFMPEAQPVEFCEKLDAIARPQG